MSILSSVRDQRSKREQLEELLACHFPKSKHIFAFLLFAFAPFLFFYSGELATSLLATGDGIWDGLPTTALSERFSFWNPYVNSGAPNLVYPHHQPLYIPVYLARVFFSPFLAFNLLLLGHLTVVGFFTYLFLFALRLDWTASVTGGLVFTFCGFISAHLDHHYMIHVAAWLPVSLFFLETYYHSHSTWRLFAASAALATAIYAGHTQIAMYVILIAVAYTLYKESFDVEASVSTPYRTIRFIRTSLVVFGGMVILSLPQILPVLESLPLITRNRLTYEYFTFGSFPLYGFLLLLFPNFFGSLASTLYNMKYWGPGFQAEVATYIGILPLQFAVLSVVLFRRLDRRICFWALLAMTSLLLAIGKYNPLYFLMFHVPAFNLFRIPARTLFIFSFSAAVLCAFFVHYVRIVFRTSGAQYKRSLFIAASILIIITGSLLLVLQGLHGIVPYLSQEKLAKAPPLFEANSTGLSTVAMVDVFVNNTQFSSPEIWVPVTMIVFSSLLLFLLPVLYQYRFFWVFVLAIICFDLYAYGHYFSNWPADLTRLRERAQNPLDQFLSWSEASSGESRQNYRVYPLDDYTTDFLWPKTNILFGVSVPHNYGPILFKEYSDLTGFLSSGYTAKQADLLRRNIILSLLSVRYVVTENVGIINNLDNLRPREDDHTLGTNQITRKANLWQNLGATLDVSRGSAYLQGKDGKVSLIAHPITLEPNSDYLVSFEARCLVYTDAEALVVDFANHTPGLSYDSAEQERSVLLKDMPHSFRRYEFIVPSGSGAPPTAQARFFTTSRAPIELKQISVRKAKARYLSESLLWSPTSVPKVSNDNPLYVQRAMLGSKAVLYENRNFLARARLVPCGVQVPSNDAAQQILWNDTSFDPSRCALVEGYNGPLPNASGHILSADYSNPDRLRFRVDSQGERSLFVLSDMFYPGWQALVDGKEHSVLKVNGVFKGVMIERSGPHFIEFLYRPRAFYIGVIAASLYGIFMTGAVLLRVRRNASH